MAQNRAKDTVFARGYVFFSSKVRTNFHLSNRQENILLAIVIYFIGVSLPPSKSSSRSICHAISTNITAHSRYIERDTFKTFLFFFLFLFLNSSVPSASMVTLAGEGLINQKQVNDKKINCIRGLAWTRHGLCHAPESSSDECQLKRKTLKVYRNWQKQLWRRIDDN